MSSRALAPLPPPLPSVRVLHAEGRVRAILSDVLRLDGEREELERELAAFSAAWEREAGNVLAELDDAERLVRRMRRIEDELERAAAPPARTGVAAAASRSAWPARNRPAMAAARRARPGALAETEEEDPIVVEPEELALKRLHRRLARAVHPDVARDDGDRARFQHWMACVNAAYHGRDLAALEVLAEKIGIGAAPGEPDERERLSRLERRAIALSAARGSLERDLAHLRASEAYRLRAEWNRRAGDGADLAAETRASATKRIEAAQRDALARWASCIRRATAPEHDGRDLRRSPRRSPLADSPLARRGLTLAEVGRPGARGLELARELEDAARLPGAWEPALTLIAFFAEAGGRVPSSIASPESFAERWDALRAGRARAPDLARALARLPRHLEVGLRHRGAEVSVGVQLTTPEMLAGVRHALASGALSPLARDVLGVLGPKEHCDACSAVVTAVHLLRTRGLDEVHGLACPRCGSVLRSFLHYGTAEGLEALAPIALEVGLVSEAHVLVGRRTVAFQMLPTQRAALTAEGLGRLFHALYVVPHALPLQPRHLVFAMDGAAEPLAGSALVPEGTRPVRLRLSGAAMRERDVVSWLKGRIERRFRH